MILTHTISVPELIWTLWCGAGLGYLIKLLVGAIKDWKWIIHNGANGIREYDAINSVLIFATMNITQLAFVIIGLIAMTQPPAIAGHVSSLTYVNAAVFVFASSVKTILAVIISTRKQNLIERVESGEWEFKRREQ